MINLPVLLVIGTIVLFGGHWTAAKLLRVRGLTFFGRASSEYFKASIGKRVLIRATGPIAVYLLDSLIVLVAALVVGQRPAQTLQVDVVPGSPAGRAGMIDGDTVVAVGGQEVRDWDSVRELISSNPNRPVEITVSRSGAQTIVRPTPDQEGRIGLRSRVVQGPPPTLGEALIGSIVYPARIMASVPTTLATILLGHQTEAVPGPVRIHRLVSSSSANSPTAANKLGAYLLSEGVWSSMLWPVYLLVDIVIGIVGYRRRPL